MATNADSHVDLPAPIAAYFTADAVDAQGVARCFTENGIVTDERHQHTGRDAIARWKTEAAAKYHYTSEPLAVDGSGPGITIITRVSGQFPGSPVELRYRFILEGDKIASLEITG